jgi:hypothetical protein
MPQKTKAELESKSPTRPLKPFSGLESIDFPRRRHPDSNWGMEVLQTSALPLGYAAVARILSQPMPVESPFFICLKKLGLLIQITSRRERSQYAVWVRLKACAHLPLASHFY